MILNRRRARQPEEILIVSVLLVEPAQAVLALVRAPFEESARVSELFFFFVAGGKAAAAGSSCSTSAKRSGSAGLVPGTPPFSIRPGGLVRVAASIPLYDPPRGRMGFVGPEAPVGQKLILSTGSEGTMRQSNCALINRQQFDAALEAIQAVFDPRQPVSGKPSWKFLPFKAISEADPETLDDPFLFFTPSGRHFDLWSDKSFQPHVAARARVATYMTWVVMKYCEVLVAYGDFYFRMDTLEDLPAAIQWYVEASQAIGKSPRLFPLPSRTPSTMKDVRLGNNTGIETILEMVKALIPGSKANEMEYWLGAETLSTPYSTTPNNPEIDQLRATIDDRLYKIRHSMDIYGKVRTLALFEPAIDPGLLLAASSSAMQFSNMLTELSAPLVNVEIQRLGKSMFKAMESKDDQELATMLSAQNIETEQLKLQLVDIEVETATSSLGVLQASRKGIVQELTDFSKLAGLEVTDKIPDVGGDFAKIQLDIDSDFSDDNNLMRITNDEATGDGHHFSAMNKRAVQKSIRSAGYFFSMPLPEAQIEARPFGCGGSWTWDFADALRAGADAASTARKERLREWKMEANRLGFRLAELDAQIQVQKGLMSHANQGLVIQQSNLDSTKQLQDFQDFQAIQRATNNQFYQRVHKSAKDCYFQTYTIAYDLAKKAERACFFEKGLDKYPTKPIIGAYWDATNNGLLAGEKLIADLHKLEAAFSETRGHDFEVTKTCRLSVVDPEQLEKMPKEGGEHSVTFEIPERLFDRDFPGHYRRRNKTVAVSVLTTIPDAEAAVAATLSLAGHSTHVSTDMSTEISYPQKDGVDVRFRSEAVPITSIAVSESTNDYGTFELQFGGSSTGDGMSSGGFLPFEGAGAISKWHLEISKYADLQPQDVTDVVLKMRYTAARGNDAFKKSVENSME
ncbi:hypothetical protein MKZ38_007131 [Zalerion maritima]|uniref:Tc toxin complex TcA C-terminal TcB-binding domain-containing protein n=1 Tax=Zalerion maritima TaxID=339359 RepID=A0AAD5RW27_9PEZI|nr:hypothetical protein MKZ38_007131 [Zalerion maritima]